MNQPQAQDVAQINQRFYDGLWSRSELIEPQRFNTWPLISELTQHAAQRLEVAPGLRPRLPVQGTQFLDISPPALAQVRAAGGLATRGSLNALPYPQEAFDLIALFDVLEHVEDDRGALDEVARVLRPGGHLLLSAPLHKANWSQFDAIVGHFRRYDPAELQQLLGEFGIRILRSAIYGMKPRNSWLVNFGMDMLERKPDKAMWWYNKVFMPMGLKRQQPLQFQPGLIEDPGVDELILVCQRD